jgi:2-polyprenyl-3-methyl-5-hydroxy-6-metoxy-1,4-benzoquinol methylase
VAEHSQHQYGYVERPEVFPFVPKDARVIADVGCSRGGFGAALRRTGRPLEIWGIDSDPTIVAEASPHYDRFLTGYFPDVLVGLDVRFDCIVFNDVLEHMVDPWEALRKSSGYLSPTGTVVASIPNLRYLPVVARLLLKGDFTYVDSGVMDRTHLRFFTKKTMIELFKSCGYNVSSIKGIVPWREKHWLAAVAPPRFKDAVYRQFVVAARPSSVERSLPAPSLPEASTSREPADSFSGSTPSQIDLASQHGPLSNDIPASNAGHFS